MSPIWAAVNCLPNACIAGSGSCSRSPKAMRLASSWSLSLPIACLSFQGMGLREGGRPTISAPPAPSCPWHRAHFIITICAPAAAFPRRLISFAVTAGTAVVPRGGAAGVGTTPHRTEGTEATEGTPATEGSEEAELRGCTSEAAGLGAFQGLPVFHGSPAREAVIAAAVRAAAIGSARAIRDSINKSILVKESGQRPSKSCTKESPKPHTPCGFKKGSVAFQARRPNTKHYCGKRL